MNAMSMIFQLLVAAFGLLFIYMAVSAMRDGHFKSPQKVVHGNYVGVTLIKRSERPLAFWFCTAAFLFFGLVILLCAWFVF